MGHGEGSGRFVRWDSDVLPPFLGMVNFLADADWTDFSRSPNELVIKVFFNVFRRLLVKSSSSSFSESDAGDLRPSSLLTPPSSVSSMSPQNSFSSSEDSSSSLPIIVSVWYALTLAPGELSGSSPEFDPRSILDSLSTPWCWCLLRQTSFQELPFWIRTLWIWWT